MYKRQRQPRKCLPGIGVVAVGNDLPALRHKLAEAAERRLHVGKVLEKVQMIRLNVQHDRRGRRKIEEGIAVFAALDVYKRQMENPLFSNLIDATWKLIEHEKTGARIV